MPLNPLARVSSRVGNACSLGPVLAVELRRRAAFADCFADRADAAVRIALVPASEQSRVPLCSRPQRQRELRRSENDRSRQRTSAASPTRSPASAPDGTHETAITAAATISFMLCPSKPVDQPG